MADEEIQIADDDAEDSRYVKVAHGVVEAAAIIVGVPLALLSLMAVAGLIVDQLWARVAFAAVVVLAVPLVITDRLLPEGDVTQGRGIFTDVLAIFSLGIAVVLVGVAHSHTYDMLQAEAERFEEDGLVAPAVALDWVIGEDPTEEAVDDPDGEPDPEQQQQGDETADNGDDTDPEDPEGEQPDEDDPDEQDEPEEMSPNEIFNEFSPAVVSIEVEQERFGRTREGGGTGFFVEQEGIIATNYHVIEDAESIELSFHDGTTVDEVWILDEHEDRDLALLEVELEDLDEEEVTTTRFGDSEDVEVGEEVVAIGNPLGLDYTLTDGVISQRRVWEGENYIQHSAPLSPGNSGGPLFDERGRVIGVNTAKVGGMIGPGENLNLAVPIHYLDDNMIASEYPDRREFGEERQRDGSW